MQTRDLEFFDRNADPGIRASDFHRADLFAFGSEAEDLPAREDTRLSRYSAHGPDIGIKGRMASRASVWTRQHARFRIGSAWPTRDGCGTTDWLFGGLSSWRQL